MKNLLMSVFLIVSIGCGKDHTGTSSSPFSPETVDQEQIDFGDIYVLGQNRICVDKVSGVIGKGKVYEGFDFIELVDKTPDSLCFTIRNKDFAGKTFSFYVNGRSFQYIVPDLKTLLGKKTVYEEKLGIDPDYANWTPRDYRKIVLGEYPSDEFFEKINVSTDPNIKYFWFPELRKRVNIYPTSYGVDYSSQGDKQFVSFEDLESITNISGRNNSNYAQLVDGTVFVGSCSVTRGWDCVSISPEFQEKIDNLKAIKSFYLLEVELKDDGIIFHKRTVGGMYDPRFGSLDDDGSSVEFLNKVTELANKKIEESISEYKSNHGNCPCPYSYYSGRSCGQTSAYSRAGGEKPLCYRQDLNESDLKIEILSF